MNPTAFPTVEQRSRELTRKELRLALDQHGFEETYLRTTWSGATIQDIAASIGQRVAAGDLRVISSAASRAYYARIAREVA